MLCGDVERRQGGVAHRRVSWNCWAAAKWSRWSTNLPAILDTEAALSDSPGESTDLPNLMLHVPHRGDVDAAFAEADVVVEEDFSTIWQFMPIAARSWHQLCGRAGAIGGQTAGQWLHESPPDCSHAQTEQVVIRYATIGGGGRRSVGAACFGARCLDAASAATGTVSLVWGVTGHHRSSQRHPYRIHAGGRQKRMARLSLPKPVCWRWGCYASTSVEVLRLPRSLPAALSSRMSKRWLCGLHQPCSPVPSVALAHQAQFAASDGDKAGARSKSTPLNCAVVISTEGVASQPATCCPSVSACQCSSAAWRR